MQRFLPLVSEHFRSLQNVVVSYRLRCVYYTPGIVQSFRLSGFHAYPFIFYVCYIDAQ